MPNGHSESLKKRAVYLPRRIYLPRAMGLGLGCIGMATALWERGGSAWAWGVFLVGAYLWPHAAFQWSSRARRPGHAERINLSVDAALTGFAVFAIGANVVPSLVALTIVAMNNIAVGGRRLWYRGMVFTAVGVVIGIGTVPWHFTPATSFAVQLATMPVLLLYFPAFGWTMWRLALDLHRKRDALRVAAEIDVLSGLLNRRTFETRANTVFARLQATPAAARAILLIIDLDHFKRINDAGGHAAGDVAIRRFGAALLAATAVGDFSARYGGDEFVVLLNAAGADEARVFLATVRANMQQASRADDRLPAMTWSVGGAAYTPRFASADLWLEHADKALYRVKERHRGGVQFCDTP